MKIGAIRSRQRDGGYATTFVSAADLVSFEGLPRDLFVLVFNTARHDPPEARAHR